MTKTTANAHRKGVGRIAFLARAQLFQSLLIAGHSQRSIYDDHAASLGISYSQFNRYVVKYLGKIDNHEHPKDPSHPSVEESSGKNQKPVSSKPPKSNFHHNPNSGNDRDDLV